VHTTFHPNPYSGYAVETWDGRTDRISPICVHLCTSCKERRQRYSKLWIQFSIYGRNRIKFLSEKPGIDNKCRLRLMIRKSWIHFQYLVTDVATELLHTGAECTSRSLCPNELRITECFWWQTANNPDLTGAITNSITLYRSQTEQDSVPPSRYVMSTSRHVTVLKRTLPVTAYKREYNIPSEECDNLTAGGYEVLTVPRIAGLYTHRLTQRSRDLNVGQLVNKSPDEFCPIRVNICP
jgi:hypothetical protein